MRRRRSRSGVSVHAISGTYVVTLGMNVTQQARQGLLGFAIRRTDHTENEAYWLKGFKTFESIEPHPTPGQYFSLREHPAQTFLWGDYTAKADHDYTYKIVPLYGTPKNLDPGDSIWVRIQTESEDTGEHAIYFNRGVAGSQAYTRQFQNSRPDDIPNRKAYIWLSRGLEEAILRFIRQADGSRFGIRAAVYEFNYKPVLEALKQAHHSGADVKIIYDARKENPKTATLDATGDVGIRRLLVPRETHTSYISHNKFLVLLRDGQPIEVWTGSTNFTRGGIFGQSNVGHLVRDQQVAQKYLEYWNQLAQDLENRDFRAHVEALSPVSEDKPPDGTTVIFSPRKSLEALEWYTERLDAAEQTIALTAAFGVNRLLAEVLKEDKDYLRYLLLERRGDNHDVYAADRDVLVSIGSHIKEDVLYQWTKEKLTNFNFHVRYIHTKFMLVDALSKDPLVVTGSANFSNASTQKNDENMLIIRGNKRVSDIYLGEFMRLFRHFYFRYHASRMQSPLDTESKKNAFLAEDDSWTNRYFDPNSIKTKQRILFA